MREGICAYSGLIIPKGSGRITVRPDGKAFLYANNKVLNFVKRKIKARFISWTLQARTDLNKDNVVKEQKVEIPTIVKILRGFVSVPAHVIKEIQERREEKERGKKEKRVNGSKEEFKKELKVARGDMRKRN